MPNRFLSTRVGSVLLLWCVWEGSCIVCVRVYLMRRTVAAPVWQDQCQSRQLTAGWGKHLASRVSTASVHAYGDECQNSSTENNICEPKKKIKCHCVEHVLLAPWCVRLGPNFSFSSCLFSSLSNNFQFHQSYHCFVTAIFYYFFMRRGSIIKIFTQVDYYIFILCFSISVVATYDALQPIIILGADRSESDKTLLL